ncbi:MAG: type II secretion system protein GspG [Myxococcales bacterium]|nr:type II secretion system protein GspG [Myxococcales bacterium]
MARRKRERTIFFPWERRGWRLPWLRSRPLIAAVTMMVLLVIFGVRQRRRIGIRSTRATLLVVRDALDAYRADHAFACPPSLSLLQESGYLDIEPKDAWGRPLVLTCPGRRHPQSYDLVSFGPTGDMRGLDRIE